MKVIFMGTPDFSVGTLEALIEAGHEVTAVVTQPDKAKGRSKTLQFSPVKETAIKHQIPVLQPVKIKEPEAIEELKKFQADIIVVVAFGQILSKEILEWPKFGCVNVHASLLPKYRGAAPIQWSILDGEEVTGVTTMKMDVGLDTGDMIQKTIVPIAPEDTGGSLFEKLSVEGAALCVKTLESILNGTATYEKQEESLASYAGMISKQLGEIKWTKPAIEIERLVRGLNPWPSAYSHYKGKMLKIWKAKVVSPDEVDYKYKEDETPGKIIYADKEELHIATGREILAILELQLEGKKRMETKDFLRGYAMEKGSILGE